MSSISINFTDSTSKPPKEMLSLLMVTELGTLFSHIAPDVNDTIGYARWKVWADFAGMSKETARQRYIELAMEVIFLFFVSKLKNKHSFDLSIVKLLRLKFLVRNFVNNKNNKHATCKKLEDKNKHLSTNVKK